jgi:hypothetical protein
MTSPEGNGNETGITEEMDVRRTRALIPGYDDILFNLQRGTIPNALPDHIEIIKEVLRLATTDDGK